ncbi:MAG: hypothetical protein ACRD96_10955, partial [Bryobacteraceae bacterium]
MKEGLVADLGCGDGALSFFLESLGCRVRAYDNPKTNCNRMEGFFDLRSRLGSSVEYEALDLDSAFAFGSLTFSVAAAFGLLYHLKN